MVLNIGAPIPTDGAQSGSRVQSKRPAQETQFQFMQL